MSDRDLEQFVAIFPIGVQAYLADRSDTDRLCEVVLDLGRSPTFRFLDAGSIESELPIVEKTDIEAVCQALGAFNTDNRAGMDGTLHRISALRNRSGHIVGLTCRVGRSVSGAVDLVRDLIESGQSILFLGKPGVGKTTKIRDAARILANELGRRVVIVDTSNEIAGDGDVPHRSIGAARRIQVPQPEHQDRVMIEAVENHMPEVIVIDEIGTEAESLAARTIAERGVQLIGTAHGFTLENLIKNPMMCDLVGGIHSVVLGDEEAKLRGTQKTILERKALPTFDVVIEIRSVEELVVYRNVARVLDRYLRGASLNPEIRRREEGDIQVVPPDDELDAEFDIEPADTLRVFPFGLNKSRLLSAVHVLNVPVVLVDTYGEADIVLATKSRTGSHSKLDQLMKGRRIPLHVIKQNTEESMVHFLRYYFKLTQDDSEIEDEARREIDRICRQVESEKRIVDATPRPAFIRRIQHEIVKSNALTSHSVGEDDSRRVRVYPDRL